MISYQSLLLSTIVLNDEDMPCGSGIKGLSISPENSGITNLSAEQLERIWEKAKKLLNTEGSICSAPGMCDTMCVASETNNRPHFVSKTKKGGISCDEHGSHNDYVHTHWMLQKN